MRAGRLRHIITIQAKTSVVDTGGGDVPTWAAITNGERPADVRPVSGTERNDASQLQHVVSHKITTRYVSGVTTKHRVLFGSRIFDIIDVINWGERSRDLSLMCLERMATD